MKRLTVVPEDNMVVVDGEGISIAVDCDPNIHAIQWNDEKQVGEIEYTDESGKGNVKIGPDDIASFLPLVKSHGDRKQELKDQMEAADVKRKKDFPTMDELYPPHLATTKRFKAFQKELPIGDQLDEILKFIDKQVGTTKEMQKIIAKSKEIKSRFPKEGE
jgi:hypothetical protein